MPIDVVETTRPFESVERRALVRPVNHVLPETLRAVVDAYGNVFASVAVEVIAPERARVVTPENAPDVTSHELELTLMMSPPSPRVRVPVVVCVPEMELAPMTPPVTVRALVVSASPMESAGRTISASPVPSVVKVWSVMSAEP